MRATDAFFASLKTPSVTLRTGTVAGWSTGQVVLDLGGGTVEDVPYLSSYSPTTGDVVLVLVSPGQLLILGKTA